MNGNSPRLQGILTRLHDLEQELETELDQMLEEKREKFRYDLYQGRVAFDEEVRKLQRQYRIGLWSYIRGARLTMALSAPVIYSLILPFALLDLMVTVYQAVCFPIYRIAKARRRDFIVIDRQHLSYLNGLEKLNCMYCGYGNGVLAYVREVAARTEQYWCPIKHARRTLELHRHSTEFSDYGDAEAYRKRLAELRAALRRIE